MPKIRVGLIRVDTHAYYYATLMQAPDPLLLQQNDPATHYYMYGSFSGKHGPEKIVVPTVRAFDIVNVWSPDPAAAERFSTTFRGRPKVCKTHAEASEGVDLVFIANCYESHSGSDHLELATPGIRKGIPTFIDKPLAYDLADARRILRLARANNTPLLSLSILSAVPEAAQFRRRFSEIAPVEFASIKGNGYTAAGQVHLISLAQKLFGSGVSAVSCIPGKPLPECMGEPPIGHIHLDYGSTPGRPRSGVMLSCASGATWHCSIYAHAFGARGEMGVRIGDFEFPRGAANILKQVKKLAVTRKPPVPYRQILENIAVIAAARESARSGRTVTVRDA